MPGPGDAEEQSPPLAEAESETAKTPQKSRLRGLLRTPEDISAYRAFRNVPPWQRNVIEAFIAGRRLTVDPSLPPLTQQFLQATQRLLAEPLLDLQAWNPPLDATVHAMLAQLQTYTYQPENAAEAVTMNIFHVLGTSDDAFAMKHSWFLKAFLPRLRHIHNKDTKVPETRLAASTPDDRIHLSMDPLERCDVPPEAEFVIAPGYAGFYRNLVCEEFDRNTLDWVALPRILSTCTEQLTLREESLRTMRGRILPNVDLAVPLPYSFGIDLSSVPDGCTVFRDQYGVWYIKGTCDEPKDIAFRVGKLQSDEVLTGSSGSFDRPHERLPHELSELAQREKGKSDPSLVRARRIGGFLLGQMVYSNDDKLSAYYRESPDTYFERIWEHKKADCDVGNSLAAEVLHQAGIRVRMVAGYSASRRSAHGATILHGGMRHAWLEVFDDETNAWRRLDLTPKGDPALDDEREGMEEENEEDVPDGDDEEQFAEALSEAELAQLEEEIRKQMQRTLAPPPDDPVLAFAEAAQCSLAEARRVIETTVRLRKDHSDQLREGEKIWRKALRENRVILPGYRGPVGPKIGRKLDLRYIVPLAIAARTQNRDPIAFNRTDRREQTEKIFGGYEVYIVVDRSKSMRDPDPTCGRPKKEVQRDAVFLLVDSIMQQATLARRAGQLKHPMPVRVCIAACGGDAKIIFPLTDQWRAKEQIQLYRSLDEKPADSTPDHLALELIRTAMTKSPDAHDERLHRIVIICADGGSDKPALARAEYDRFLADGIPVRPYGITESANAMQAVYPGALILPDASQLARCCITDIVKELQLWYKA